MNSLVFLAFLLLAPMSSPDGPEDTNLIKERNPFKPVQKVSETATIQEATPPAGIRNATPEILETRSFQTGVPPILDDLRSVALMKGGRKLAMFGRRIVALNEEIEGYRVVSISLDQVVLKKGEMTWVRTLDEFTKRPRSQAEPEPNIPSGMDQILSRLLSSDSAGGSNALDWVNQSQSVRTILKQILGNDQSTNAVPGIRP